MRRLAISVALTGLALFVNAPPASAASVTFDATCGIAGLASATQNLTITANLPGTVTAGQSFTVSNITVKSNTANPAPTLGASDAVITIGVAGAAETTFSKTVTWATPPTDDTSPTDFGTQALTAASSGTVSLTFTNMTNHIKVKNGTAWGADVGDATCTAATTQTITSKLISAATSTNTTATSATSVASATTTTAVEESTTAASQSASTDATSSSDADSDSDTSTGPIKLDDATTQADKESGGMSLPVLLGIAAAVAIIGGGTFFLIKKLSGRSPKQPKPPKPAKADKRPRLSAKKLPESADQGSTGAMTASPTVAAPTPTTEFLIEPIPAPTRQQRRLASQAVDLKHQETNDTVSAVERIGDYARPEQGNNRRFTDPQPPTPPTPAPDPLVTTAPQQFAPGPPSDNRVAPAVPQSGDWTAGQPTDPVYEQFWGPEEPESAPPNHADTWT